jgi:CRISPR type I-E-associated protein CasB/Cse2
VSVPTEKFVDYLEYMRDHPFRHAGTIRALSGALALSARDAPIQVMMKIYPWSRDPGWHQECHLMVAALFATHPLSWQYPEDEEGVVVKPSDMGMSMARLRADHPKWIDQSVEMLLIAEREVLYPPLIGIFSGLAKANVPVDFSQLLRDLLAWWPEGREARRWARAYVATDEEVIHAEVR